MIVLTVYANVNAQSGRHKSHVRSCNYDYTQNAAHLSFLALLEDAQSFVETESVGGQFAAKTSPLTRFLCLRCVYRFRSDQARGSNVVVSTKASVMSIAYDSRYFTLQCPLPRALVRLDGGGSRAGTAQPRLDHLPESPFSVTLRGCRPHVLLQSPPMHVCTTRPSIAAQTMTRPTMVQAPLVSGKRASNDSGPANTFAKNVTTTVAICIAKPVSLRHTHSQTPHTRLDYVRSWVKFHLLLGAAHIYISDR